MALFPDGLHVVYINLDRRVDRRDAIEKQCAAVGIAAHVQRLPATDCGEKGYIGCSISHLGALKLAQAQGWAHVLVLEDDFEFLVDGDGLCSRLNEGLSVPYDVLMLSYVGELQPSTEGKTWVPVRDVQTASGYVVHHGFLDTLIANMEEGLRLLLKSDDTTQHAVDMWWKSLQTKTKWFACVPRMGRQTPSFSDNLGQFVDYTSLEA
jgi:hypothetical protein